MRYSSCMSRFIVCRVACCPMGTLCAGCAVLWAALGRAGICLFCSQALRRGAVWWRGAAWCCPVCRFAPLVLVYCLRRQLCASCSATCCYCPTAFTGCRLSSCRIPSVAVPRSLVSAAPRSLCVSSDTYHYSSFHNYLMITVTYNLSDNGIYPMQ